MQENCEVTCISLVQEAFHGHFSIYIGIGIVLSSLGIYEQKKHVQPTTHVCIIAKVHKAIYKTIFDRTTECIISLKAAQLRNPKLPGALDQRNRKESSRIISKHTRPPSLISGLYTTFRLPNAGLLLWVLVLEQVSIAL